MTDRNRALIAIAVLGDALVFVLFIALTPIEHGSVEIAAFWRTGLPFAGVWLLVSPWLGAFRISTLTRLAPGRLAHPPHLARLRHRGRHAARLAD